ncbi:hypothetical protein V8C35DRAFT_312527 [Trichoderma chlorosporum]
MSTRKDIEAKLKRISFPFSPSSFHFRYLLLLLFLFASHPALVLVVHIPCRHHSMAANHFDTPKIVGDDKVIVCFLLCEFWYTCMGFHFISFHSSFSIYFFLSHTQLFALSAVHSLQKVSVR